MAKSRKVKRPITRSLKEPKNLKPSATRQIIRQFHVLLKNRALILDKLGIDDTTDENGYQLTENDSKVYEKAKQEAIKTVKINHPQVSDRVIPSNHVALVKRLGLINGEIEKRGGLKLYQTASIKGQDQTRGGDSSKMMMKWIREKGIWANQQKTALEIGSLSSHNEISTCKMFKVTRIDIHSQEPDAIIEQDFLTMELPKEQYDLVSCSLVVNFVPKPELRGDMLKRTTEFLKRDGLLFLVLPLPCIENSRYCDKETMDKILRNLGYETIRYHSSPKLAYWLCELKNCVNSSFSIAKKELHGGAGRNNFSVVVRPT